MIQAKVLWFDSRHNEGQLLTDNGLKLYFNYSAIDGASRNKPIDLKRDTSLLISIDEIGVYNVLVKGQSQC